MQSTAPPPGPYSGQDLEFPLPAGVAGSEVTWVSVWCRQYSINFGHAMLDGTDPDSESEPESGDLESGSGFVQLSLALVPSILLMPYWLP